MGFVEERVKRMWIDIPGDIADGKPEPVYLDSLPKAERAEMEKKLAELTKDYSKPKP